MPDIDVMFYEDALRKAEAAVEEAGRTICPYRGEAVGEARSRIHRLLEDIQDAIHNAYKLAGDIDNQ